MASWLRTTLLRCQVQQILTSTPKEQVVVWVWQALGFNGSHFKKKKSQTKPDKERSLRYGKLEGTPAISTPELSRPKRKQAQEVPSRNSSRVHWPPDPPILEHLLPSFSFLKFFSMYEAAHNTSIWLPGAQHTMALRPGPLPHTCTLVLEGSPWLPLSSCLKNWSKHETTQGESWCYRNWFQFRRRFFI